MRSFSLVFFSAVVNGLASPNHLKYMAKITSSPPCTGVLYQQDIILTAASCFNTTIELNSTFALKVEVDEQEGQGLYSAISITQHPRFLEPSEAGYVDLAVIKINRTGLASPVILESETEADLVNSPKYGNVSLTATLWRLRAASIASLIQSQISSFKVKVEPQDNCLTTPESSQFASNSLCISPTVARPKINVVDRGSPVFSNVKNGIYLRGLLSSPNPEKPNGFPALFTHIGHSSAWIKQLNDYST